MVLHSDFEGVPLVPPLWQGDLMAQHKTTIDSDSHPTVHDSREDAYGHDVRTAPHGFLPYKYK